MTKLYCLIINKKGAKGVSLKGHHVYVEIRIRGSMEQVWERTHVPELHNRWDLRFSAIEYLPRPDPHKPQRFLYETRIGFGLAIRGEGESTATREGIDGTKVSSLRFWSDSPLSLIRVGNGYWKYIPTNDGIKFLTVYDYTVRYGLIGQLFDRLVFRPLIGWATAYSFSCLRLWIEQDIPPSKNPLRMFFTRPRPSARDCLRQPVKEVVT